MHSELDLEKHSQGWQQKCAQAAIVIFRIQVVRLDNSICGIESIRARERAIFSSLETSPALVIFLTLAATKTQELPLRRMFTFFLSHLKYSIPLLFQTKTFFNHQNGTTRPLRPRDPRSGLHLPRHTSTSSR